MPIIPTVGRRSPKMRLIIASLYTVLALGAVTMVYPFLVMVSTSFTSEVDKNEFRAVPRYFYRDDVLFRKYVEAKYNEDIPRFNQFLSNDVPEFKELPVPAAVADWRPDQPVPAAVADWMEFKKTLPRTYTMLGGVTNLSRITPEMQARYQAWLRQRFKGSLEAYNQAYGESAQQWEQDVLVPIEDWNQRSYQPVENRKYQDFLKFRAEQPARYFTTASGDGLFQDWLRLRYGAEVAPLNKAWGTNFKSRFEVRLAERRPAHPRQAKDWEEFVRTELPSQFVGADPEAAPLYRRFLAQQYEGSIDLLNRRYGTRWASFDVVPLPPPQKVPVAGMPQADWLAFVEDVLPAEMIYVQVPEILFRKHLEQRYGSVASLNKAWGTKYTSFLQVAPPYMETDWVEMQVDRKAIRREFIVRNYREVFNYIVLHGRSLWNTLVLVVGLMAVTLIVNPLCAYGLSRFNLPQTYKILLFLLATMSFPAEVSAIPRFLLLKQFHLLNTYWALILPAMANGYSIFLLKGFFDSLPRDLYEAATIDGASETLMFSKITIPLSMPVMAVIALSTFTAAYGSFMWALLVCQNPKMWTLMVWLSQMQQWAPTFVMFAALVLAAIPTLLVFVFCQNIIMRGIIIPTEK
ncbi:MAG: ABC transporter permease subunit [Armatimonadetes bacterium]|nr:ABC transporter permease subunit [Armatimonadota bacterium]